MTGELTAPAGLPPGSDVDAINDVLRGIAHRELYGPFDPFADVEAEPMPFDCSRNGIRPAREVRAAIRWTFPRAPWGMSL